MPQRTQHSLIHVLLLWTTILSIVQAVFIILFFKTGHHGLSQNSSVVAPERTVQFQTPSPPPERELLLGKGNMLTFKATEVTSGGRIKWEASDPSTALVSKEGDVLTIQKDGYYYLNLQVTLKKPFPLPCNETRGSDNSECSVSLKWKGKVVLYGWINRNTGSTGLLGKVEELPAGGALEVTIVLPKTDPKTDIDDTEYLTHLDIIYMLKP